jgi:tetratricopeptide (TPR) repeat protein
MKQPQQTGMTLALSIGLTMTLALNGLPAMAAANKKTPAKSSAHRSSNRGAVKHSGGSASGALQQGIQNYNRGFIAKAIPRFEQATRLAPNNPNAFLWLARAYRKQGMPADFAKAADAYRKVLTINPNQVEALTNLGEFLSWNPAHREEAIQFLKKGHELSPNNADLSKKLAEALLWNNNGAEALKYAEPISARFKNDHHWMSEYAQMLSAAGRLDEAATIYNTTLRAETNRNIDTRIDVARLLAQRGQADQAQTLFGHLQQQVHGLPAKQQTSELTMKMASLAFDLGLYEQSAIYDESLPDTIRNRPEIQLRMARAWSKASNTPGSVQKAVSAWAHLYEAGQLTSDNKLEAADYLQSQAAVLSSTDMIDTLYREVERDTPGNGELLLRMARRAAQNDPQDTRFAETIQTYRKALGSADPVIQATARKELLDYLKSDKTHPQLVEGIFKELIAAEPNQIATLAAYAEYISWQPDRRAEALRMYSELAKLAPEERDTWEGRLEEVMKWHKPTTALIPVYQSIVDTYPNNKTVWLTVARAYRNDPNYYKEALDTYGKIVTRFPDDSTVKKEWLDLLMSNPAKRDENIQTLKALLDQTAPNPDPDVLAAYGRLLSYTHRYSPAMDAFEQVLSKNPEHREALLGKGYVILWSGRKLEAKQFFLDLRKKYPDDLDIAIGLAQTDKMLGRYDEALRIMREIKPLLDSTGQTIPQSVNPQDLSPNSATYLLVANTNAAPHDGSLLHGQPVIYDVSIAPAGNNGVTWIAQAPGANDPVSTFERNTPLPTTTPSSHAEMKDLRSEIDALSDAVASLKLIQASSAQQLRHLDNVIHADKPDANPLDLDNDAEAASGTGSAFTSGASSSGFVGGLSGQTNGLGNDSLTGITGTVGASGLARGTGKRQVGEGGMTSQYATYSGMEYDTNPLLSGMGRFRNNDVDDLEKGLRHDLRPMIRAGYMFSSQDGNDTTTRIRGWGFPNQVSFSLTPQIRLRGGIQPMRWYLPRGVSPSASWGIQYGLGATVKYWDRLTLDGDVALTRFTQSQSSNLTFQAQMQYDFTDSISAKLGVRRIPQYNSLLTLTGLQPNRGAFRGELVGQARENGVYGELNLHPFNPNWDWNLGYEWAFIDGSRTANNRKNQAFTSLGHTWHYGEKQQVRLGYEFLYFGYSKNATNGFFDTTSAGFNLPVVSLKPVTAANSGYVFGGYYSPHMFIMNAGRVDFRGSLFNRFLEYKLGGSLGAQTVRLGHNIRESGNRTSLSSSFDANVILNFTDWLAAYGDVDYLNAGGQFNRWRFGGGLILRPKMDALSPLFGSAPMENDSKTAGSPLSNP